MAVACVANVASSMAVKLHATKPRNQLHTQGSDSVLTLSCIAKGSLAHEDRG